MPYRVRESDRWVTHTCNWSWSSDKPGSVAENYSVTGAKCIGVNKGMGDWVTPGFRKLVAEGHIINNEMWSFEDSSSGLDAGWAMNRSIGSGYYSYGNTSNGWLAANHGAPVHCSLPSYSSTVTEAATAALANVAGPEVQGLVTLAELQKTLRMLRRPMSGLQDYIRRTGRQSSKRSFSAAARDSWLEYRYGWRPFLKEMETIVGSLGKEYRRRFSARATRVQTDSATSVFTSTAQGITLPVTTQTTRTVTARCGTLYEHAADFNSRYGFRLSDVPGTMWELVPYSFVVDWFVNTSDFLEALTPRVGVNYLARFTTVRIVTTSSRSGGSPTNSGFTVTRAPGAAGVRVTKSMSRTPEIPPIGIVWKEGSLRSVLSDLRSLDSLALLTQQLRK